MRLEDLAWKPAALLVTDDATAGTATAEAAAIVGKTYVCTEVIVSTDKATTAIATLTLTSDDLPLGVFNIPVGTLGPLQLGFARALIGKPSGKLTAVLTSLGVGVTAIVNVYGFNGTN